MYYIIADAGDMCDCRAGMLTRCNALFDADHADANCLVDQTAVETTPSKSTTTTTSTTNNPSAMGLLIEAFRGLFEALANMFQ